MINRGEIRKALTGPIASICTPFHPDGTIDFDSLHNEIDFDIHAGSKAIVLTYGDSLYSILTDEEVAEVTRVVARHASRKALVVAADRQWATPREVEFARFACDVGADVLMVLPPDWAHSCTLETLVEHYASVTQHIPVMVVTNYLSHRPMEFALTLLKTLTESVKGIVAVKDDVCGEFGRRMSLLVHERWAVFTSGSKQDHLNAVPYGCDGYMSNFIMFKPEIAHDYWNAVHSEDFIKVRDIISAYDIPFVDFIRSLPGGPDAGIHGILELFGIAKRWRRRPYYSLNDEEMERLADFLKKESLL